ncbi:hypothetical protein M3204_03295 [Mesobacillus subterraneus]|uniref:hypothetical protein n=1 Tax=Mesobacillus subterraneus TaxID=285983 RepID=UPI00203A99A9|nr:hypothetical protein [Mesobacillus subterraneus]MCM3663416.1 hypothetical protein [Mesobacillus subterraneus]MCM3683187.1 hypothetical protein [Mesobacillus subterraneus]
MRIRHFILMGVFLGGAAFFPNNALAEKNGSSGQPVPHNSEVHNQILPKAVTPEASNKAVPVNPDNVNKKPDLVTQKPEQKNDIQKTQLIKPVQKLPDKTNRSNEKVIPSIKKKMKAGKPPEPAVKEKGRAPTQAVPKAVTAKFTKATKILSPIQRNYEEHQPSHSPGGNAKPDVFIENDKLSVSKKKSSSLNLVEKSLMEDKQKTPFDNRKKPRVIDIMSNPPQRTQSPGGQTNEQISAGAGSISFITNWIDWDENFGWNFGQIYTSRQAKYCHQWINAPPSPPPKEAPFFLTFIA